MPFTMKVDIVSAEKPLYAGEALMVFASGAIGDMCIKPGHAQLLTFLRPGEVRVINTKDEEEIFYISGGILEVQPHYIAVLADNAERAADLDEAEAEEAVKRAQQLLDDKQAEIDYAKALAELAQASAQLQAIRKLRERVR